jgi:hypothetical protein
VPLGGQSLLLDLLIHFFEAFLIKMNNKRRSAMQKLASLVVVFFYVVGTVEGVQEIVYALNAGGPEHIDSYGIRYSQDKSNDGIASDFGMRIDIRRALPKDQALYQTERYGTKNFGYDIPLKEDGDYVIVLKFCEVYFKQQYAKVSYKMRHYFIRHHHVYVRG